MKIKPLIASLGLISTLSTTAVVYAGVTGTMSAKEKQTYYSIQNNIQNYGHRVDISLPINNSSHPLQIMAKSIGLQPNISGSTVIDWTDMPAEGPVIGTKGSITIRCGNKKKTFKITLRNYKKVTQDIETWVEDNCPDTEIDFQSVYNPGSGGNYTLPNLTKISTKYAPVTSNFSRLVLAENTAGVRLFANTSGSYDELSGTPVFRQGNANIITDYSSPNNKAIRLDGGSAELPSISKLNIGTDDFTVRASIKTQQQSLGVVVDKRREDSFETRGFVLFINNGNIGFQLADGDHVNYNTNAFVADGQWHDIEVSVDRDQPKGLKVLVDDKIVAEFDPRPQSGSLTNNKPMRLGRWSDDNSNYSDRRTKIDITDVSVINSALPVTDDQICVNDNLSSHFLSGSTNGFGNDLDGTCGLESNSEERVVRYTATTTGTHTFDTVGSNYDTVLFALDSCSSTVKMCNDDMGGGSYQSSISMHLEKGQQILLGVSGYNGKKGNFKLNVTKP